MLYARRSIPITGILFFATPHILGDGSGEFHDRGPE